MNESVNNNSIEMLVLPDGSPFGYGSGYCDKMATDKRLIQLYKDNGNNVHPYYLRNMFDLYGYENYVGGYSGEWDEVRLVTV